MNQYETTVIITPVLSEEELNETLKTYRDFLKKNDAEIVEEVKWGLRQLAYPIQNKTTGIYYIFEYKGDNTMVDKLELNFRRDENIMRFLTVKLDKYAAEYNDKKRLGLVGRNKKVKSNNETVAAAASEEN